MKQEKEKEKREVKERGLTLYSTGKYNSRQEAFKAAKEELKRVEKKKNNKNNDSNNENSYWGSCS